MALGKYPFLEHRRPFYSRFRRWQSVFCVKVLSIDCQWSKRLLMAWVHIHWLSTIYLICQSLVNCLSIHFSIDEKYFADESSPGRNYLWFPVLSSPGVCCEWILGLKLTGSCLKFRGLSSSQLGDGSPGVLLCQSPNARSWPTSRWSDAPHREHKLCHTFRYREVYSLAFNGWS